MYSKMHEMQMQIPKQLARHILTFVAFETGIIF